MIIYASDIKTARNTIQKIQLTLGKSVPFCPLAKRLEFAKTRALCTRPGHPMHTS